MKSLEENTKRPKGVGQALFISFLYMFLAIPVLAKEEKVRLGIERSCYKGYKQESKQNKGIYFDPTTRNLKLASLGANSNIYFDDSYCKNYIGIEQHMSDNLAFVFRTTFNYLNQSNTSVISNYLQSYPEPTNPMFAGFDYLAYRNINNLYRKENQAGIKITTPEIKYFRKLFLPLKIETGFLYSNIMSKYKIENTSINLNRDFLSNKNYDTLIQGQTSDFLNIKDISTAIPLYFIFGNDTFSIKTGLDIFLQNYTSSEKTINAYYINIGNDYWVTPSFFDITTKDQYLYTIGDGMLQYRSKIRSCYKNLCVMYNYENNQIRNNNKTFKKEERLIGISYDFVLD